MQPALRPRGDATEQLFTQGPACLMSGATYRELDYWERIGGVPAVVPARGSGSIRRFSLPQVALARLFVVLQSLHVDVPVRIAVSQAVTEDPELWGSRIAVFPDGTIAQVDPVSCLDDFDEEVLVVVDLAAILAHVAARIPPDPA